MAAGISYIICEVNVSTANATVSAPTRARKHLPRPVVAAATMLFVCSVPAQGQYRGPNAWVQVGFGTGLANITCDGCDGGWSSAGRSLFASLGGMVTPRFGFGIGLDRWWRSSADTDAITTRIVLLIRYRPEVHSGAFVEAGAGLSQADLRVYGTSQGKRSRFGLVSRVGYDVPVLRMAGDDICVTPQVSYLYGVIEQLIPHSSIFYLTEARHRILSVGLAVGIRMTK